MNLKYISIVVILIVFVGGGILAYQYWSAPKEVKPSEEIVIDETADWKTYRNEKYGFEFKYPIYMEIIEKDIKNISINSVWGPIVIPATAFDLNLINPLTDQKATAIDLNSNIHDLEKYQTSNYYFGKIAYDTHNEYWYKIENERSLTEEDVENTFQGFSEDVKNSYWGIPRVFVKTISEIPVYENFIYGDVGLSTVEYILVNKEKNIILSLVESMDWNGYDISPKENQEFVDKILKDFPKIFQSVQFLK